MIITILIKLSSRRFALKRDSRARAFQNAVMRGVGGRSEARGPTLCCVRAVVIRPADPRAPERRLAQTAAALEVVAVLAVVSIFAEMGPDLLGAEKVPVMAPKAADEAADEPHRAWTRERGTVGEFIHRCGARAQASLVSAGTHG